MNVFFSKPSRKFLARCENKPRAVIVEAIERSPDKGDIRMLKGQAIKNTYRLRVGRHLVVLNSRYFIRSRILASFSAGQ